MGGAGGGVSLSYTAPANIDKLIEASIDKIYKKKLQSGDIDAELFRANANTIYKGVTDAATKDGVQGPGSNLSTEMKGKLKVNAFTAAAFKQYKNNEEIAALLIDENGKQRSFAEFKKLAKPMMDTFNKNHLQSEYNLAVRSSQSAAKWATYVKRGGKIQYRTVGDSNVRDEHAMLQGTIKAVDDPFWNYHFPPNGWGCRCGTSWVTDDTPDVEPKGMPEIPAPFRNNVGKTGQIFNPAHPYFADVDSDTAKQLTNIAEKEAGVKEPVNKELRKQVLEKAKTLLVEGALQVSKKELNKPITFTTKGIKEAINQPHKAYDAKNESLLNIIDIIKSSKYIGFKKDAKNRAEIVGFHYYETIISEVESLIVIMETKEGKFNFYSITEKNKPQ